MPPRPAVGDGGMHEPRLLWLHNKTSIRNYTVAGVSIAVAVGIARWPEAHLESAPVSLLLCAVMLSAWLGGVGPGVLAAALSAAAFANYYVNPLLSLAVAGRERSEKHTSEIPSPLHL